MDCEYPKLLHKSIIWSHTKTTDNDGDLTTCMSSPDDETIAATFKLEEYIGHNDGQVVSSGTRVRNVIISTSFDT